MITKSENMLSYIKHYFRHEAKREFFSWYQVLRYYSVILPILVTAFVAVFVYILSAVPKTAYLAVGNTGSSYGLLAEKFQTIFNEHGLKLELVKTGGMVEGLRSLDNPDSKINASFLTAGSANSSQYPNLVSLGSIQYNPIWFFYRGKTVNVDDPAEYFAHKRIGIGTVDAVSNKIFRRVLELNHKTKEGEFKFTELPHPESARLLQEGKLDAVFIVDSYKAPVVQMLLNDPDIKIMNINLADAYVRQFPFLEKLIIPKGSINIENVIPREDITLLGTTTNLLVEKDTSPAIQWAFMQAANEVGKFTEDFFSRPGTFPKYVDMTFPLSPVAKRYYSQGMPGIFDYLPLWLASLIDHIWVMVLAFFTLIYPLYKWAKGMRSYPSKKFLHRHFLYLREMDEGVGRISTKKDAELALAKINGLIALNVEQWLSETEVRFYFTLKSTAQGIRKRIEEKLSEFN